MSGQKLERKQRALLGSRRKTESSQMEATGDIGKGEHFGRVKASEFLEKVLQVILSKAAFKQKDRD